MASTPTYKPSVYVGRVDPKKIEPLIDDAPRRSELPGDQPRRRAASIRRARPGSPSRRSRRCRSTSSSRTSRSPARRPRRTALDKQVFVNWDPYVNHAMTLPEAMARSCDTYFYQVGLPVLFGGRGRSRMQEWARKFGFGGPTGIDVGAEAAGLVPTPAWRKKTFKSDWDADVEPGRLDPALDRPEGRLGDAAPDGALLRDDRERRQARHAVRRLPGRDTGARTGSRPSSSAASRPTRRPRSVSTRRRSTSIRDGLYSATHSTFGTSSGVFGNFPVPSPARRAPPRRSFRSPATPRATSRISPGGAATGPRRPRSRGSSSAP